MVTYLSDDWVAALDGALGGVPVPAPPSAAPPSAAPASTASPPEEGEEPANGDVIVQYRVSGGPGDPPGGERSWFLDLRRGGVRARPGSPPSAPVVTFAQSWDVAVAVARGERSTQEAVLAGDIRVTGNPTLLFGWREILAEAQDRVADLAAVTEFGAV
jgi:hypothetical protein